MVYEPQYYPGNTSVAKNRKKHMSDDVEKLRDISDEDLTAILGHRAPGSDYPSTHPPLSEMGEPDCPIREIVEPTPGAAAGDRVRYVQFADSMYNAPATPYFRSYHAAINFRGCDPGTLSGRQIVEMRERDLEEYAKRVSETEITDWGLAGMRGCTVHGHSLRLQEDGIMFDMLDRRRLESGVIVMDKDQVGVPIDRKVNLGKPMREAEAAKRTTIYRVDNVPFRMDKEVIEYVHRVWELRTLGLWLLKMIDTEHELANPPGWQGTPTYMRYLGSVHRLFVISIDHIGSWYGKWGKYGYHIIRFHPQTGFHWEGNLYDSEFKTLNNVLSNNSITFLDRAWGNVDVYFGLRVESEIRMGKLNSIAAMGKDSGDMTYLVTTRGEIYQYKDVKFYRKYSPIGQEAIYGAIVFSEGKRILIEKQDPQGQQGQYAVFLLEFNENRNDYEISRVSTIRPSRLGHKHVELDWPVCGDPNTYFKSWITLQFLIISDALATYQGTDYISIYYYQTSTREFHLVKYKDAKGELHEFYYLGAGVRDWDICLKGSNYEGIMYLIATLGSKKLVLCTLDITLNLNGESYFQIRSQELDPNGDVYCVQWVKKWWFETSLLNPRFEIDNDGSLRFKGTSMPEPINPNPLKQVYYRITVITGDKRCSHNKPCGGTDANVYITLYGDNGQSEEIHLPDPDGRTFENGKTDYFDVILPFLGLLNKIRIRHDNTGPRPGWYLNTIYVKDQCVGIEEHFPCDRWLATDEDDGSIDRILYASWVSKYP